MSPPAPAGELTLRRSTTSSIAVGDDEPSIPVHASWHALRLVAPPYVIDGRDADAAGLRPGRALARPTGEFVLLRDVRLAVGDDPGCARPLAPLALVNRYVVERVAADLMLGFFFPGAVLEGVGRAVQPSERAAAAVSGWRRHSVDGPACDGRDACVRDPGVTGPHPERPGLGVAVRDEPVLDRPRDGLA